MPLKIKLPDDCETLVMLGAAPPTRQCSSDSCPRPNGSRCGRGDAGKRTGIARSAEDLEAVAIGQRRTAGVNQVQRAAIGDARARLHFVVDP